MLFIPLLFISEPNIWLISHVSCDQFNIPESQVLCFVLEFAVNTYLFGKSYIVLVNKRVKLTQEKRNLKSITDVEHLYFFHSLYMFCFDLWTMTWFHLSLSAWKINLILLKSPRNLIRIMDCCACSRTDSQHALDPV